jgi:hypothetical protein
VRDHPVRNSFIALVVIIVILGVILSFVRGGSSNDMTYGDVLALAHSGRVSSVKLSGRELDVRLRDDGTLHHAATGYSPDIVRDLRDAGATVGDGGGATVGVSYAPTGDFGAGSAFGAAAVLAFLAFVFYAGRWSRGAHQ